MLVNLIENALKFSPPESAVHVRVTSTRKEVDRPGRRPGAGPSRGRARAGLRAVLPRAAARPAAGAGLGLAIARGFAEANGGRVWAESRPGQGTSFALALPVAEAPVGLPA